GAGLRVCKCLAGTEACPTKLTHYHFSKENAYEAPHVRLLHARRDEGFPPHGGVRPFGTGIRLGGFDRGRAEALLPSEKRPGRNVSGPFRLVVQLGVFRRNRAVLCPDGHRRPSGTPPGRVLGELMTEDAVRYTWAPMIVNCPCCGYRRKV